MARFESKIFGIDLGTTNTLVSYYDEIAKRYSVLILVRQIHW